VNSAFLVTEVLHRSYALFSPAHLAVASIRTLRRCIELISGFGALVLVMEWLCGEAQAWWAPHGCARHAVATCLPGAAALGLGGARTRKRRGTPFEGGGSGSDALRLEEGVEADVPAASTSQHHASQRESILATGAGAYAQPMGGWLSYKTRQSGTGNRTSHTSPFKESRNHAGPRGTR
jgi:hypothetical protein